MSIETAVRTKVKAAVGAADVVLTSADPAMTVPFVVLTTQEDEELRTTGSSLQTRWLQLEVDCWAATPTLARDLAELVKGSFRDFTGVVSGYQFMFSRFYNTFDKRLNFLGALRS